MRMGMDLQMQSIIVQKFQPLAILPWKENAIYVHEPISLHPRHSRRYLNLSFWREKSLCRCIV